MAGQENSVPTSIRLPDFATSDAEAQERFEKTRSEDPFPEIPPALLNGADLIEYIARTGMVHPFRVDPEDPTEMLKPASCGMRLAGRVVYWEDRGDADPVKVTRELGPEEELELKRNSIVYVTLEPVLRMPDYIAARFNLTIRDIYRGLLVGTGPLVDPTFVGRISIPLHNLTYNNYTIKQGEPIAGWSSPS
jgi:deoxycytidine triphosphate deaminase